MEPKMAEEGIYWAVKERRLRIDALGRIWRAGARRAENPTGKYLQVRAMRGGKRSHALAHRLVWRHFNGPIPAGLTINHKNGDTTDNRPENLELATPSEQVLHSMRMLGRDPSRNLPPPKLTIGQAEEIRRRRLAGEKLKSIAKDYGVSDRTVSKIALGHSWTG